MPKRLSIVSVIICIFAILAGALFEPVESSIYEYKNGPGIINQSTFSKILKADGRTIIPRYIDRPISLLISKGNGESIELITEISYRAYVKTRITKLDNGMYELDSGFKIYRGMEAKKSDTAFFRMGARLQVVNEVNANRRIDRYHFPNIATRKERKLNLLKLIADQTKDQ